MTAVDDARAPGGGAGEFERRFHALGTGVGEEHLLQVGRVPQQFLGKRARQGGDVHLDEIGQIRVEHAF